MVQHNLASMQKEKTHAAQIKNDVYDFEMTTVGEPNASSQLLEKAQTVILEAPAILDEADQKSAFEDAARAKGYTPEFLRLNFERSAQVLRLATGEIIEKEEAIRRFPNAPPTSASFVLTLHRKAHDAFSQLTIDGSRCFGTPTEWASLGSNKTLDQCKQLCLETISCSFIVHNDATGACTEFTTCSKFKLDEGKQFTAWHKALQ